MRLICHAGTHKTGSTSFQRLCAENREKLLEAGLLFPQFRNWQQHSYLAWHLQMHDMGTVGAFFESAVSAARTAGCHTILLSGEDFENVLLDAGMAKRFAAAASEHGIGETEWYVVHRDPFDYLQSIYAEMSRNRVCINITDVAKSVIRYGYWSVGNEFYNYTFVFDILNAAERFRHDTGMALELSGFDAFRDGFIGKSFLAGLVSPDLIAEIAATASATARANRRDEPAQVEFNYLCNFLGISPSADVMETNRAVLEPLLQHRLKKYRDTEGEIREAFAKRFPAGSPVAGQTALL